MRDKNKPTGKEIQVILTKKLPGHNVLKKMVKNRNVHLQKSAADDRTEHKSTQTNLRPGSINDSHSFNRSRCMVQIVAEAEQTVVLKSRSAVSRLDFLGIRYYIPSLIGCFGAVAPEGVIERMPEHV